MTLPASPSDPQSYAWRYTGQRYDSDFGLYDYKARTYSPSLGRFLQPNPLGVNEGPNLYEYVSNSPLGGEDPSGMENALHDLRGMTLKASICDTDSGPCVAVANNLGESSNAEDDDDDQRTTSGTSPGDSAKAEFAREKGRYEPAHRQANRDNAWMLAPVVGAVVVPAALEVGGSGLISAAVRGAAALGRALGSVAEETGLARATCCFVAGTLVDTQSGLQPIETIKVGDFVKSRDPTTGISALKRVTKLIHRHDREIYTVRLQVGPGQARHQAVFETTDDHPWRSISGGWLQTIELERGTLLQRAAGPPAEVERVVRTGRTAPTYNLEVADFHTYFVGEDRIWVHNNACSDKMLAAFQRQFERDGMQSLLKSQAKISRNLAEHEAKLPGLQFKGGVEREIRVFRSQLEAIEKILSGQ